MMSNALIKIRLRRGDQEIELEGAKSEVEELLEKWWKSAPPASASVASPQGGRGGHKESAQGGEFTESDVGSEFDPVRIANQFKEHPEYGLVEERVLHKQDRYNKVAAVLWGSGEELTSGEITSVLKALDVKIDQPGVSNTIKAKIGKFIHSGARKGGVAVRYKLTSTARKDFEAWLRNGQS